MFQIWAAHLSTLNVIAYNPAANKGLASPKTMVHLHVDVDNLWNYEREYGVPNSGNLDQMYTQALPKLLGLFKMHNQRATFFVVGCDLASESCKTFCEQASSAGHEIANHTYSHPAHMYRMSKQEKEDEILRCNEAITKVTNKPVVGFRAPGYYLDRDVVEILIKHNFLYDTSVMPSIFTPLIGKFISWKAGKPLDKAFGSKNRAFFSTHIKKIYSEVDKDKFIYEVPIATLPIVRLPVHSTSIFFFGTFYWRLIQALSFLRSPDYTYVFHSIDALDYPSDGALINKVPTLKWPLAKRLALIETILESFNGTKIETTQSVLNGFRA